MSLRTVTHLNFRGQARDALTFYQAALAGEMVLVSYADAHLPEKAPDPSQLIWGQVTTASGFHVMAYDVQTDQPWEQGENAFYVSLRGDTEAEAQAAWDGLSAGSTIIEALAPSFWSPLYGKLHDRFGVIWLIDVTPVS